MKTLKRLLILTLLTTQFVTLKAEESQSVIQPFALITVPKSGSHMIIKALHLFTGGVSIWHTRFPSLFYIPPKEGFLYTHFCLSPELEEDYSRLPELKKILLVRDMRDVCVSIIGQMKKAPWPGMSKEQKDYFKKATFDEQLMFVINYDYDVQEVASYAPNSLQVSVRQVAEQSLRLSQNPNNLTCRYEDLVGSEGGGSKEAQMITLKRIAEYIGSPVTEEEIEQIADQLYGNEFNPFGKEGFAKMESTFQKGKIGSWETAFKEEHKIAFKEKLGHLLIALGYEEDNNW